MELIPNYYNDKPGRVQKGNHIRLWRKNISIIGEPDSVIDGDDCADLMGKKATKSGIFITNEHLLLEGYTIQHFSNFTPDRQLYKCNCKILNAMEKRRIPSPFLQKYID